MRVLYLDTARLGQTSPGALRAQLDFARLTTEAPSSLYFEDFLQHGEQDGQFFKDHFPGLADWPGIAGLKQKLCAYAGVPAKHRVAIGSRSGNMFELAAEAMLAVARTILVTDLSWLPHVSRLRIASQKRSNRIVHLRLRNAIFQDGLPAAEVVDRIVDAYLKGNCDAILLPKVDNLGIKLPVGDILNSIRERTELRFAVVDAAQALGQVSLDDCWPLADVVLAGTHKWLCSGQPLSLAFYGRERSTDIVEHYAFRSSDPRANHDPLLAFTEQLSGGQSMHYSETVNIGPLFSCFGALEDVSGGELLNRLDRPIADRQSAIAESARIAGWLPVLPSDQMRSRILLLRDPKLEPKPGLGTVLRRQFAQRHVSLSAYDTGYLRISSKSFDMETAEHFASTLAEMKQDGCVPPLPVTLA